jgi:hypothetical protein
VFAQETPDINAIMIPIADKGSKDNAASPTAIQ